MSITRKIFFYSIGMTFFVALLIFAYFLTMLSPLYANYLTTERLIAIQNLQVAQVNQTFAENRGQYGTTGLNFVSLIVAKKSNYFTVSTVYGDAKIEIVDTELEAIIQKAQGLLVDVETLNDLSEEVFDEVLTEISDYSDKLLNTELVLDHKIFQVVENSFSGLHEVYRINDPIIHNNHDMGYILETGIVDDFSQYTTYIAIAEHNEHYYLTLGTAMTPQLNELQPVIIQSLPNIIIVGILLIVLSTYLFARIFITPIRRLADTTQEMKSNLYTPKQVGKINEKDELQQLEQLLDSLYCELQEALQSLQEKNIELEQNNKNQQVFLAASSHQLKTPIASALLLIEGMLGKIGKYADTDTYLPTVRTELLEMRKIVDEILELNNSNISKQSYTDIEIKSATDLILQKQQILIDDKQLHTTNNLPEQIIFTHEIFVHKVLDNLIKNAVTYTPQGSKIDIYLQNGNICIENFGITIEEELLPQIFEPFVRKSSSIKGHGLGLHIVKHYAKLLEIDVQIMNTEHDSVKVVIIF